MNKHLETIQAQLNAIGKAAVILAKKDFKKKQKTRTFPISPQEVNFTPRVNLKNLGIEVHIIEKKNKCYPWEATYTYSFEEIF